MALSTSNVGFSNAFYSQLLLVLIVSLTVRVCVSMWGHSGEGKPPMFGDFEAQRHWMEITVHLPYDQWYVNTPYNDLMYWGLDYPPLTAYHMMINGKIAQYKNSSMVELTHSQGIEGPEVKFFMRSTVLAMDLLIFLPAAVVYFMFQQSKPEDEKDTLVYIIVLLGYPGLLLVDNGHFQYNNVSLGLAILATVALTQKADLLGAFLFCLALNYKQMELYHALPFFAYLLGTCIKVEPSKGLYKLFMLAMVVIITFIAIWSPFLNSVDSALAVLKRLFPLKRGLYEDKVANFWCAISVVIKFKELFNPNDMAFVCLLVTALFLLPSFLYLLRNPTLEEFHYAKINASLIFFLFSFHVHEKTILLAAVPACLVVKSDPFVVFWFLLISVFSMLPLLLKDGLLIPTVATVCLFWIAVNHFLRPLEDVPRDFKRVFQVSMLVAVCLVIATVFIPPPLRYPDLFPMLIAIYSCGHFIMFTLYFHLKQFGLHYTFRIITEKKKKPKKVDFSQEVAKSTVPLIVESATAINDSGVRTRSRTRKRTSQRSDTTNRQS